MHLAVYDAENAANAVSFLSQTQKAFPFRITHVLTDRGSCFTADAFEEACVKLKVIRRTTKPYTPQTNGMVERFNGRVTSEALGINVAGHADLETLLIGFNHAYNRRRQRVLNGHTPCQIVEEHIMASPKLANPHYRPTKQEDIMQLSPSQFWNRVQEHLRIGLLRLTEHLRHSTLFDDLAVMHDHDAVT